MIKHTLTVLFLAAGITAFGQINRADSTVQVITYWDKGDQQNYTLTYEKNTLKGSDTVSREQISCEVEITVLDQTDTSYTVQWRYRNMQTDNSDSTFRKIMNAANSIGLRVIYRTNELGEFEEVLNAEEIQNAVRQIIHALRQEFNTFIINRMETMYSSKEAIEFLAIKEILLYHTFHGGHYLLGELLQGTLKAPNPLGTDPFDVNFTVYLDEIAEEDENFIMRAEQEVNKEQLIDVTYNFLLKIAQEQHIAPLRRDELKDLKNETKTASRIHETGWVIYSIQITTVTSDDATTIEERIIEIQ